MILLQQGKKKKLLPIEYWLPGSTEWQMWKEKILCRDSYMRRMNMYWFSGLLIKKKIYDKIH